jgi:hypothetical protein
VEQERPAEPDPHVYSPETELTTTREPGRPQRERRGRRRGLLVPVVIGIVATAAIFLLGLVVGRAIQDTPRPGGEQTIVRTLVPSTIGPAEVVTVTVTEP